MSSAVLLDGQPLETHQVEAVACGGMAVEVSDQTLRHVADCRRRMKLAMADGRPHYGLNTGFGALGKVSIDEAIRTDPAPTVTR